LFSSSVSNTACSSQSGADLTCPPQKPKLLPFGNQQEFIKSHSTIVAVQSDLFFLKDHQQPMACPTQGTALLEPSKTYTPDTEQCGVSFVNAKQAGTPTASL
jgi:hypothetical protein